MSGVPDGRAAITLLPDALTTLIDYLRQMPPTGPLGFEGLVASALAEVSGLTFRLARSGSQFGRDATTPAAPFAIAMEAKRYGESVSLQELIGKATLAAYDLRERIELWALGMTVELGEQTGRRLSEVLERQGIALMVLDWPATGLPPLAVLLAAARPQVAAFVSDQATAEEIDFALHVVEQDDRYERARQALIEQLTASTSGLDALRRSNIAELRSAFADKQTARSSFGQSIVPIAGEGAVPRPAVAAALTAAIASRAQYELIVVLGGEGAGKTWAIADWWARLADPPVLILAAGSMTHALLDADISGEIMLARLLAGRRGGERERWERRIGNWKLARSEAFRFIVVIDGLNERASGKRWATILERLAPVIRELGGVLIATCRAPYWQLVVARRLQLMTASVEVGDFSDEELAAILQSKGYDRNALAPNTFDFMRNPRICALALPMLSRLQGDSGPTRDRLLLEHMRQRMLERGDEVAHDDVDLGRLLARHASEYRNGNHRFDRDCLPQLSSAAQRGDGRPYADDLAEIADGRFFEAAGNGRYLIRPEALPLAFGLLLRDELAEARERDGVGVDFDEVIAAILEPISGFDRSSAIVDASVAVACDDADMPTPAVAALVNAWFGVQNRDDESERSMVASLRSRPDAFLDAFEQPDQGRDHRELFRLLYDERAHIAVAAAIGARLPRWLTSWSHEPERFGHDAEANRRRDARLTRTEERLASFRPRERATFEASTAEYAEEPGLASAAIRLLWERPLQPHARSIVGFALVAALCAHRHGVHALFCWLLRLNEVDFDATRASVAELIAPLRSGNASPLARQAAAVALEALGHPDDRAEVDRLFPREPGRGWRRVEQFCSVDPLDPTTAIPDNLDKARTQLAAIDQGQVWHHFSTTAEDHDLGELTPALARFDPDLLTDTMRTLVRSAPDRRGMALRQLAWQLPELSPLFQGPEREAVNRALDLVIAGTSELEEDDVDWVAGVMAESLLPHLDIEQRVALLLRLPPSVCEYTRFGRYPIAVDAAKVEALLSTAQGLDDSRAMARTLISLTPRLPLTPTSRSIIVTALKSADRSVAVLAADVVRSSDDTDLDREALSIGDLQPGNGNEFVDAYRSAAFASAVVRLRRFDLIPFVDVAEAGYVAAALGGPALERFRNLVEGALDVLLRPITVARPPVDDLRVETDDDGRNGCINFNERLDERPDPFERFRAAVADRDGVEWAQRRADLGDDVRRFVGATALGGASALVRGNWQHGLDTLIDTRPETAMMWAERVLQSCVAGRDQVQSLGAALAAALSRHAPTTAAAVFRHVLEADAVVDTLVGQARIPIALRMLFASARHPALDEVRAEVFHAAADDARIELLVAAAEASAALDELDRIIAACLASAGPGRRALGLTIAGMRATNPQSDALLEREHGGGFVGEAGAAARDAYRRGAWHAHWTRRANEADDAAAYWAFATLAAKSADRRALVGPAIPRASSPAAMHGASARDAVRKQAERRTKKRGDTLFGLKKPTA